MCIFTFPSLSKALVRFLQDISVIFYFSDGFTKISGGTFPSGTMGNADQAAAFLWFERVYFLRARGEMTYLRYICPPPIFLCETRMAGWKDLGKGVGDKKAKKLRINEIENIDFVAYDESRVLTCEKYVV